MEPLVLNQETKDVLEDIRLSMTEPGFGLAPKECQELVRAATEPVLHGAALPMVLLNAYRWYARELGRLFATKFGPDLAMNLELVLRTWRANGLELNTMQFLITLIYGKLKLAAGENGGGQ